MSVKNRIRHALLLRSICCLGVAISLFFSFTSCMDELKNYEAELKAIHFVKVDKEDVTLLSDTVRPSTTSVPVSVSHDADLKSLVPIIEASFGATTSVESGKPYDFSNPVTISISSEDGKKRREYRIQVTKRDAPPVIAVVDPRNSEAMLENFAIDVDSATITPFGTRIIVEVPIGTDITSLTPTFTLSAGAIADFESGTPYDFTDPLVVFVTSENQESRVRYTIVVREKSPELSPDAIITDFEIINTPHKPQMLGSEIFCYVPKNMDLTRAIPVFGLSEGATANIESGRRLDCTNPVEIVVTSEDGSKSTYTLVLEPKKSDEVLVESVAIKDVGEANFSDSEGYTFYLPEGKDIHQLVPIVTVGEDGTCSLTPGEALDFSTPQTFTVTSEDGNVSRLFKITVYAPNASAKDPSTTKGQLLSFEFSNSTSKVSIIRTDIYVRVPAGTDLTQLVAQYTFKADPTEEATGWKSAYLWSPKYKVELKSGESSLDYSEDVELEAWRDWLLTPIKQCTYTVHVSHEPLDEVKPAKLLSFDFKDIDAQAQFRGDRVEVSVPRDTDLTTLVPEYTLSEGATANLPAGQPHDFSSPVKMVVTGEDGKLSAHYNIVVTPKANDLAQLEAFRFKELDIDPSIAGTSYTFFAGTGVDVTNLTPEFTLSRGATSDLKSGVPADFSKPVKMRVQSEDGNISRLYTIIVDQRKNYQADILTFKFKEISEPVTINSTNITFPAPSSSVNLAALTPIFTISSGATSDLPSGIPADFSQPVKIKVTSEDGTRSRTYTVRKEQQGIKYDFESWASSGGDDPYETPKGGWGSSNTGMASSRQYFNLPTRYPVRKTSDSHRGRYAAVISTEKLEVNGNPIAAGALFLGSFNGSVVLTTPLAAPQFGVAWAGGASMPDRFKGWYKYKSGAVITNKSNLKTDKDEMSIYAVLYYGPTLTGKDKDFRNYDRVIAIAEIEDRTPKRDWTYFDLEFKPKNPLPQGETPRFSIVFSSSLYGSTFEGAIGSELVVDDLEITLK